VWRDERRHFPVLEAPDPDPSLPARVNPFGRLRVGGVDDVTFPSRSTWIPCGQTNIPPPKLLISFPDSSKWWTGFALAPRQPGAVPGEHRSVAHTDLPSRSLAT